MADVDQKPQPECQARPDAGGMICDRCALAWDTADTPPKCMSITIKRVRAAMIGEAERIETSAACAVSAGFRRYRDQQALTTASELRHGARFVDLCLSDPEILKRLARNASKPKSDNKNNNSEAAKA